MSKGSYTANYIKNLVTQTLATVTGLLSLFIVVPFLSGNKVLYGIYSVCISLTIFFNYADLGLITAGQKYAAESFIRGDTKQEIQIVGFTTCALLLFCILVAGCLLPLAINPALLISNLHNCRGIASQLIFILIFSSPFVIFKRICSVVFTVRIEQYKYNTIVLFSQILKILSVLYFFGHGKYMIVEYYFFTQVVDFISAIVLLLYVVIIYKYGILYFKNIRLTKHIWNLVKDLAFVSLFTTITWLLYYELDLIVLAKLAPPEVVALYSTAFTLLSFSRNFFSIVYTSFTTRYNHYYGLGQLDTLKSFFIKNIVVLFPIVFFPVIIFVIAGTPFVMSWAGPDYGLSALYAKILIGGSFLAAFSYPSNQYLLSTNRTKELYIASALLPVVFWIGVSVSYIAFGVLAFAIFKSLSQILSACYNFYAACKCQYIRLITLLCDLIRQYFFPVVLVALLSCIMVKDLDSFKGFESVMKNLLILGSIYILSLLSCLIFSRGLRSYAVQVVKSFHK